MDDLLVMLDDWIDTFEPNHEMIENIIECLKEANNSSGNAHSVKLLTIREIMLSKFPIEKVEIPDFKNFTTT